MVKIAIVGSQGKHWTPVQRTEVIRQIHDILISAAMREGNLWQVKNSRYSVANPPLRGKTLVTLVSGGCGDTLVDQKQDFDGGVDRWAEIVADVLGIKKDIKYAPARQWEDIIMPKFDRGYSVKREDFSAPFTEVEAMATIVSKKGYKTRNLEIARDCDILYCIDPAWRKWSGGRWTMQEAEKLGKEVRLVLI